MVDGGMEYLNVTQFRYSQQWKKFRTVELAAASHSRVKKTIGENAKYNNHENSRMDIG